MVGEVSADHQPIVGVQLFTISGDEVYVDAVLDTGFTDSLLVPPEVIDECGYDYAEDVEFLLGNGETVSLPAFKGSVLWHGNEIEVFVVSAESVPLLGMRLLNGSRVVMDVIDGGPVIIEPLSGG